MKIFLTLYIALFLLGFVGLGYMHEQVHVAIYRGYGIGSHVEYFSYFPDMVTIADEVCPTEMCTALNSINEIVTYPLMIFYVVFGMGIFIIIICKELLYELEKEKLQLMEEFTKKVDEPRKKKGL